MDLDKLIDWVHQGTNDKLLESSNQDFPPSTSEDEVENTTTNKGDATKEEKEPPYHGVTLGKYEEDLINIDLDDLDGEHK